MLWIMNNISLGLCKIVDKNGFSMQTDVFFVICTGSFVMKKKIEKIRKCYGSQRVHWSKENKPLKSTPRLIVDRVVSKCGLNMRKKGAEWNCPGQNQKQQKKKDHSQNKIGWRQCWQGKTRLRDQKSKHGRRMMWRLWENRSENTSVRKTEDVSVC